MPDTQATAIRAGQDAGYTFQGPWRVDRRLPLSNGLTLEAVRCSGVTIGGRPQSPFHDATLFSQATTVRDASGAVLARAQLIECTDPDGDTTWAIGLNWRGDRHDEDHDTYRLVQGTGKWAGIAGTFTVLGPTRSRADDHSTLRWEAQWHGNAAPDDDFAQLVAAGAYTAHDTGYSFHGPHVVTGNKELASGLTLVANTQAGVLLSETPNSPRHNATCYDRGTTIKTADGATLGDVMLLEDTDADGDVVWLYHEWWYGQGPGTYAFLGGTGKWAGISGVGRTLGMVQRRADDHYMPTWEMYWRLDR